ncbi:hypothetical protein ACFW04_001362 [Cataglyphis niger]
MMRCVRFQSDKRPHWNAREVAENVTTNEKVDNNNDNSFEKYDECAISNHSTPVTSKQNTNNAEESQEPDHYQSPIMLPCTQEGGNEVAWDWQSSLKRTPESRNKGQNVHCETPKGTKLLHKKRNSDSPLLYKPLKRKTINMENMENIGQFAAELQALTKQMSVIKHNDQDYSNNQAEKEVPILADTNYKEEISTNEDNKQNSIGKVNNHNNFIKAEINYSDLFDDSIDDDMIRCTQEIEEKLNSITDKGSSTHSEPSVKKEELSQISHTNNASNKNIVQSTSNENFKELSTENIFHRGTNNNNTLKTYSKLSLKKDSDSSIHIAKQTDKNLHKTFLSNNNIIHSSIRNPCDNKKLLKNKATKSLDFPDDSFDDCLATCFEEEKLPAMFESIVDRNDSMKSETTYGRLTHAPLKLEANSFKCTSKGETSSANLLADKKFFKSKSLSDQYISQNAITNTKNKANPMRSMLHLNPTKNSAVTYTSITRASVSTNPIVTNASKVENSAILLTRGANRTHGSYDVNRCTVKEDGDRFVRHHSTGNMKNDTKEVSKTASQPAQCTPEEIERKRLQALMRLQAKRKMYAEMKITNNINR